jgi:DnaJ homologue, subfamily C, member 28, conserved domain
VTERKPPGIGFQSWVERQIQEAMERGEFDNLPGAGKSIADLDKPHDELWWIKDKLRRENLSYLPATLALRKEAEDALATALAARSEGQVRRILAAINRKILDGNRKAASGPPLNLMPFDVDRVVADWRERQQRPTVETKGGSKQPTSNPIFRAPIQP